jgi:DNA-binding CsgD family transcriptional regulator
MNDASNIYTLLEEERQRIAQELERNLVGSLNLLLAQAVMYEQSLANNPMAKMAVAVLATLARQSLQQVRDIIATLAPSILADLGFEPALEWYSAQTDRLYGTQLKLTLLQNPYRLPSSIELTLFRTVQNLVEIIIRECQPTEISLHLKRQTNTLTLLISHNSQHILDKVLLQGIQERFAMVGGKLENAKIITLQVPLIEKVELTSREIEVLKYLAEGLSNKEIARIMQISPRTVNFHLDNIYSKLAVSTRTEAVLQAIKLSLVQKPG